ncbi:DedA family protein [Tumebacillus sp. ITR2]|uniref:DedA family protein n=1 Tax=Tumebacillus amylolyticus TaxID=2801339 RepID=A0ABS1JG16_9BACL|nr:DedA family protein [Tumebacillus amylolyticus]MBL0388528.1 DedA family protein [Tumebacillus amylolyticus]
MVKDAVLDFVTNYGYYGLFISLVLGIVGLPIPDEILMTYCGYLVSQSVLNYWITLLTALAGSVSGISISYLMGRRFGSPLVEKYGRRLGVTEARLGTVNSWYARFGKIVLMVGYFIPGIRHVTAFAAGLSRMSYPPFALFAYLGAFIWTFTFITLGKTLGVHWTKVSEMTHNFVLWVVVLAVVGGVIYVLYRWRKRKSKLPPQK